MSNFVISLLITLGASTWFFNKLQNTSGRNTRQSVTAAGVAGLIIFIVIFVILGLVF